jgi:phage shock protein A
MGLVKRVGNLFTANLNDLVDQCENPEKMLRQAVRDMETALGKLMDGAARAIAHHKLLSRQLLDQQRASERHTRSAEAAVARGDDEAARRELGRKNEHQQLADALGHEVESAQVLSQRLRNQVTAMRIKLAEARRKLADISARSLAADARRKFVQTLPTEVASGAASSTFDLMCARVEQSEAETEALLELLGEPVAAEPIDADIEAELQALKAKVAHVTGSSGTLMGGLSAV